jgi:hypothetical protein
MSPYHIPLSPTLLTSLHRVLLSRPLTSPHHIPLARIPSMRQGRLGCRHRQLFVLSRRGQGPPFPPSGHATRHVVPSSARPPRSPRPLVGLSPRLRPSEHPGPGEAGPALALCRPLPSPASSQPPPAGHQPPPAPCHAPSPWGPQWGEWTRPTRPACAGGAGSAGAQLQGHGVAVVLRGPGPPGLPLRRPHRGHGHLRLLTNPAAVLSITVLSTPRPCRIHHRQRPALLPPAGACPPAPPPARHNATGARTAWRMARAPGRAVTAGPGLEQARVCRAAGTCACSLHRGACACSLHRDVKNTLF